MRKRMAVLMALIVIMSVSGCGREEIEYVEGSHLASDSDSDSDTDNGEKGGQATVSGSLAEQIGAPERWVGEYEGNNSGMTGIDVFADVNLDGVSDVNVYHTESIKLTEEYKRNFLETLSEGVIYDYDDEQKPKVYWRALIEEQQNVIASIENMNSDEQGMFSTDFIELQYEILAKYQERYETAPENYVVADDFSGNEYIITYLGMDFVLCFIGDDDGYVTCIYMDMLDAGQLTGNDNEEQETYITWNDTSKSAVYDTGNFYYQPENNGYVREPEQIEQEIQTFLSGLGISGFEMVQNYNINIYTRALDGSEVNQTDGCGVRLFRSMDGAYLCGEEYESESLPADYSFSDDGSRVDGVYVEMNRDRIERIELSINDTGVLQMRYYFPMEWTLETKNVQILSFDAISEYLIQYARELEDTHPIYTNIDLIYCIYSEDEGAHDFMVVPAWRFYSYKNSTDYQYEIMVNAIDGSRIDISEN